MRDDLFEALRTPPVAEPMPAQEVRRRGDRLRRRRTALSVVAVAAAVAVIAGGALALTDDVRHREAPPIDRPAKSAGSAPHIRDDFPLTAGWPAPSGDGHLTGPSRQVGPIDTLPCRAKVPAGGDRLGALLVEGDAGYRRELRTYADVEASSTAWADMEQRFEDCPTWRDENGATYRSEVEVREDGDAFQATLWNDATYAGAISVTRVGTALLVEDAGTEGHGRDMASDVATAQRQQLAPVVGAMCAFSTTGCDETKAPPVTTANLLTRDALQAALAEHPFAEGATPIDWKQEPIRDVLTFGCADQPADFDTLQVLARDWTAPAGEVRTVIGGGGDEDASRAFDHLAGALGDCPDAGGLRPAGDTNGRDGTENGSAWRVFTADAPEVCTECDTRRLIGEGVAKVGNRVAVVRIELLVDAQLADMTGAWVDAVLNAVPLSPAL